MGGQPFAADGVMIDTRKLAKVLAFDVERGLIEVESGIMWPQLLEYLTASQRGQPRPWTFSQKQTGADRLTIGGSLSSNIHGRGLTLPPFIGDIESFKIVNAAGQLLACSRTQNPELFKLAIGGYGLFGFVYSVTLRLVPRQKLERTVEVRDVSGIMSAFAERVREGCTFGDFQYAIDDRTEDFLRRGVFSCYKAVPDDTPLTPEKKEMSERDWVDLLLAYFPSSPNGNLVVKTPTTDSMNGFGVKVDHHLTSNQVLSGRYIFGDSLQSAPTALLAAGAVVIAFGEQYFDQRLAHIGGLRFIHFDAHAVRDLDGARRHHLAVDLDRTCAARAQRRLTLQVAQGGDVDTRLHGNIDKISAFFGGYGDSVDLDLNGHLDS
jgi:hypothetical protein